MSTTYCIWPNYSTYPYTHTIKQFCMIQIAVCVILSSTLLKHMLWVLIWIEVEAIQMSIHNICFYKLVKVIQMSTHNICFLQRKSEHTSQKHTYIILTPFNPIFI